MPIRAFPSDLHIAAAEAMSAISNAVTHNRYTTNPDYSWSHGIAIYYPHTVEYFDSLYNLLPIATGTNWGFFISGSNITIDRGDVNGDNMLDISDAVYLIAYIFAGGPAPNPLSSGDANCDDAADISDAVYLISYIFAGGPAPCGVC